MNEDLKTLRENRQTLETLRVESLKLKESYKQQGCPLESMEPLVLFRRFLLNELDGVNERIGEITGRTSMVSHSDEEQADAEREKQYRQPSEHPHL